jgi:hypothetical protein
MPLRFYKLYKSAATNPYVVLRCEGRLKVAFRSDGLSGHEVAERAPARLVSRDTGQYC